MNRGVVRLLCRPSPIEFLHASDPVWFGNRLPRPVDEHLFSGFVSYKKLTVLLGTVDRLKTVQAAWREAEVNALYSALAAGLHEEVRFGALCNRYMEQAMPARHSTRKSYMTLAIHNSQ
jgi:tellurite resistance-related uncharacterized protein